jgi:hypothetical protein
MMSPTAMTASMEIARSCQPRWTQIRYVIVLSKRPCKLRFMSVGRATKAQMPSTMGPKIQVQ